MSGIIFDVETVGQDFELLDETSKEYFLKYAETDQKKDEAKNSLAFYPLTAQIITIGMLEADTRKGFVYYQNGQAKPEKFTEGEVVYISGSEREILTNFWSQMKQYAQFITFNGRTFDCPFIMIRSAIQNIKASKNLMPYRYGHNMHVDLADQLTFYDAMRRKFSLHMWCKAFGIKSPKDEGITGLQVKDFYREGRYKDIARYCLRDIEATKKLYLYWDKYIKFDR
ncbi:MAG: ribonuclease H-like domain-containing protein [Candidatus Omnitrophota bacterium]